MPSNYGTAGSFNAGAQQQAPQAPTDGVPVFYLYCRSAPGKPWYPVSAMKGDGQSKGLINAVRHDSMTQTHAYIPLLRISTRVRHALCA